MATKAPTFYEEVTAAVNHFKQWGFRSQAELDSWTARIRRSALLQLKTPEQIDREMRAMLTDRYRALVTRGGLRAKMPEVSRMGLERVKPKLRKELDRRIMASANLIKLNRQQAVDKTLQRFQGWATSIPEGGSRAVDVKPVKDDIRKSIGQMDFVERRVSIDQSHKLVATIQDITATENGALAVRWNSPWLRPGYDFRKDHKERDQKVYAIRGNEALEKGLMKAGDAGYYDEITNVGEEVFCSCWATYIFALRKLPPDMLTKKGAYALPVAAKAEQ